MRPWALHRSEVRYRTGIKVKLTRVHCQAESSWGAGANDLVPGSTPAPYSRYLHSYLGSRYIIIKNAFQSIKSLFDVDRISGDNINIVCRDDRWQGLRALLEQEGDHPAVSPGDPLCLMSQYLRGYYWRLSYDEYTRYCKVESRQTKASSPSTPSPFPFSPPPTFIQPSRDHALFVLISSRLRFCAFPPDLLRSSPRNSLKTKPIRGETSPSRRVFAGLPLAYPANYSVFTLFLSAFGPFVLGVLYLAISQVRPRI